MSEFEIALMMMMMIALRKLTTAMLPTSNEAADRA
jgi:hypothetical protein